MTKKRKVKKDKASVLGASDIVVHVTEAPRKSWKEVTAMTGVSRNGAAFTLSRKCTVGRLILIEMTISDGPKTELFPMLSIVQYCSKGQLDGCTVYHIGVGFIGRDAPESYLADPEQNYRIIGMSREGLWQIAEANLEFKNRKKTRYRMELDVRLTLVQKKSRSTVKEYTRTRNIAATGVAVFSDLEAEVGDTIKFACKDLDFYALAVVRSRKEKKNEMPTLHLEFVEHQFPVIRAFAAQKAMSL